MNITIPKLRHIREKSTIIRRNRTPYRDDYWKGIRVKFFVQTAVGGVAMIVLFLVCCSYLYGTLYRSSFRHKNMHVLAVEYDEDLISRALRRLRRAAGTNLSHDLLHSPDDYPTPEGIYASVRRGKYWGAVYTTENASYRLEVAFQGGPVASSYDPSKALSYIWNQEYYTTFAQSAIQTSLQKLVVAVGTAYMKINGTKAFPFATTEDINPDSKSASVLFTTVSMAMPPLQQSFFLLVLNGVCRQHQIYSKMTIRSSTIIRRLAGIIYTLGASLCQSGYYWASRETWEVNGVQLVLTWMTLWLLMHVHLNILDAPLELQPGFYHWGICLSSQNSYLVLVTVWTGGADNRLYLALPILFSWWIVINVVATLAHTRACHMAFKLEESEEKRPQDPEAPSVPSEDESETSSQRPFTSKGEDSDGLERDKTMEDRAMQQRSVYGPSTLPAF
ncbi:uncharacterized protein BDZ99DRAFT_514974 [Mytilinidion resinicola]|uniref:DUF3533 domain-containing protein n=1 Tax=Mytilinidion resinicola TaxID=574789 RepID=A0A6A6Z5J7_9PEZI|nr:uncharacterized protein BDZ99DRAFT_514974 [Mytilinidion resinicola]KAF2816382.1 hypothetical protein BDZ99DRAFT_514974 [Mytilinidion resinicola]